MSNNNNNYPPNIYGFHDLHADWIDIVTDANRTAWATTTHAVGSDPKDMSGVSLDTRGGKIGIIARLNNGYGSGGTIPLPRLYNDFSQRCANFVKASPDIQFAIIGNEIQMQWDFPDGQAISLADYMRCYILCYDAIKRVAPHVKVGPMGAAAWSNKLAYPGNERGDWITLQRDTWALAGSKIDALYIHAYSHGYDPLLVTSKQRMDGQFTDRYYHFQVYKEFMDAVPAPLRALPVFITETNGDGSWTEHNSNWVKAMYEEVDKHNKSNAQQIWAATLFRWAEHDTQWDISKKSGSLDDFRQSLERDYRRNETTVAMTTVAIATGVQVVTLVDVNLRASAGLTGSPLLTMKGGEVMEVAGTCQEADGLIWWNVRIFSEKGNMLGWIAQAAPDGTKLLAVVGSSLTIGDKVATTTGVNVRQEPGRAGAVLQTVGAKTPFTLVGGPTYVDGLLWWETQSGWVAEKASGVNLIERPKSDVVEMLSAQYGIDHNVIKAILEVESGKSGFTGHGVKIRLEPHVLLDRLVDSRQRELFGKSFQVGTPAWSGDAHRMNQGGHWVPFHDGGGLMEYRALNLARSINEQAAYESISIGAPQIMGFHFALLGYTSAQAMHAAFSKDLATQIEGMFTFLARQDVMASLRGKDFRKVAQIYNGTANMDAYSSLMLAAYNRLAGR